MTPTERDRERAKEFIKRVGFDFTDSTEIGLVAAALADVRREAMDAAYEEIAAEIEHDEGALGGAMGDQPLRDCKLPEAIRAKIGGE